MTEKVEAQVYYSNSAYITANDVWTMAGIGEFTIGNPSIATVDAYGNVTGVSKGETTRRSGGTTTTRRRASV